LYIHVDRYSKYRAMGIHMIPHTLEYHAMIALVIVIIIVLWESTRFLIHVPLNLPAVFLKIAAQHCYCFDMLFISLMIF
jgi:hypothetical protein